MWRAPIPGAARLTRVTLALTMFGEEAPTRDPLDTICRDLLAKSGAAEVWLVTHSGRNLVHLVAYGEHPRLFFAWTRPALVSRRLSDFLALLDGLDTDHIAVNDRTVLLVRASKDTSRDLVWLMLPDCAREIRRALMLEGPAAPSAPPGSSSPTGAPAHAVVFAPFPTDRKRLN